MGGSLLSFKCRWSVKCLFTSWILILRILSSANAPAGTFSRIWQMHRCTLYVCFFGCLFGAWNKWGLQAPGCASCAVWERSGVILPGVWSSFFFSICVPSRSKIPLHPTSLCSDTMKRSRYSHLSSQFWLRLLRHMENVRVPRLTVQTVPVTT